jgi:REP element-mobilizing transposase RayT
MPGYARSQIVVENVVGVYHCITRCVRRAFLCGDDRYSGKNYDHRKKFIRRRLQELASVFGIDICGYAVMSNHLHVVLRVRPDLAQEWSDDEVALRWRLLFLPRDETTGEKVEPEQHDLDRITSDPDYVAMLRDRLTSLSWFMRCLNEPIAREANREDKCTGRFWEGRFRSVALLDEAALLACSAYVDLNPVRAGIADTPEESQYTSVFDRIQSLRTALSESARDDNFEVEDSAQGNLVEPISTPAVEPADAWLCELTLNEAATERCVTREVADEVAGEIVAPDRAADITGARGRRSSQPTVGLRASNQGYLPITIERYLELLDWTGRALRAGSRGTIPVGLSPILNRLGLNGECWLETVSHFGRWFKRAAGGRESLASAALRSGRRWFQGQAAARVAFQ